jgi:ABC-type transport system involved in cytochrome bd biosynthesis fused ATPase/permease subunit
MATLIAKTTLGQVLIDGKDIRELNLQWLRGQMALVSQEPALFRVWLEPLSRFLDLAKCDMLHVLKPGKEPRQ